MRRVLRDGQTGRFGTLKRSFASALSAVPSAPAVPAVSALHPPGAAAAAASSAPVSLPHACACVPATPSHARACDQETRKSHQATRKSHQETFFQHQRAAGGFLFGHNNPRPPTTSCQLPTSLLPSHAAARLLHSSLHLATTPSRTAAAAVTAAAAEEQGGTAPVDADAVKANINRLVYRSRQRGFLELDLLLGQWVQEHLPALKTEEMNALEKLMEEETPDLFQWLTSQSAAPKHVADNLVFSSIKSQVDARLSTLNPAAKAQPGMPWVRGWEDIGKPKEPGAPPAGNQ